jgi:hypothetical protein
MDALSGKDFLKLYEIIVSSKAKNADAASNKDTPDAVIICEVARFRLMRVLASLKEANWRRAMTDRDQIAYSPERIKALVKPIECLVLTYENPKQQLTEWLCDEGTMEPQDADNVKNRQNHREDVELFRDAWTVHAALVLARIPSLEYYKRPDVRLRLLTSVLGLEVCKQKEGNHGKRSLEGATYPPQKRHDLELKHPIESIPQQLLPQSEKLHATSSDVHHPIISPVLTGTNTGLTEELPCPAPINTSCSNHEEGVAVIQPEAATDTPDSIIKPPWTEIEDGEMDGPLPDQAQADTTTYTLVLIDISYSSDEQPRDRSPTDGLQASTCVPHQGFNIPKRCLYLLNFQIDPCIAQPSWLPEEFYPPIYAKHYDIKGSTDSLVIYRWPGYTSSRKMGTPRKSSKDKEFQYHSFHVEELPVPELYEKIKRSEHWRRGNQIECLGLALPNVPANYGCYSLLACILPRSEVFVTPLSLS